MNTPVITPQPARAGSDFPPPPDAPRDRGNGARRVAYVVAAVVAIVAIGVAAIVMTGDSDADVATTPPLELTLGDSNTLASCLPVSAELVAAMSPAFAGTVTSVNSTGETSVVTLDVDRWYAGGDAATVQLQSQSGLEALIDGFDFVVGERYLITAAQGTVNFCGVSGLATPELTAIFDQAFAT